MRIVLVSQWYPPEPAQLVAQLAQTLQQFGHDVTVLTGFPNYPSGKLYPGYAVKSWQLEQLEGVPVVRVPLYPEHSRSVLKRVANYASFAAAATVLGPALVRRPDVVHVYHPPLTATLPAIWLSRVWDVPLTLEVQDLWPETLAATGMVHNVGALATVGRVARWVYGQAAAIRVISQGFRDNLAAKGVPPEKIHVISNWVDVEEYRPREGDAAQAEQLGLAGRFNVMFAGTIGLAQGVDTMLDAAALLADLPQVQLVLVGDGADYERARSAAAARGLTNVRFLGRYPAEAMSQLYALADVLLVHLRDDPLFRITIPHKVFAYMASGKPVLIGVPGDAAAVVEQSNAGLSCPPGNAAAMAQRVREFYGMSPEARAAIGENARCAAVERYSRVPLVRQMESMLRSAVVRAGGRP